MRSAALMLVISLCVPASAEAARVRVAADTGNLRLAGEQVLWSKVTDHGYELRAVRPGEEPRLLRAIPVRRPEEDEYPYPSSSFGFAATPNRVAFFTVDYTVAHQQVASVTGSDLETGPIDGPYTRPPEFCGPFREFDLGLDMDGDHLAYEQCSERGSQSRIVVRDLADGDRVAQVEAEGPVGGVRLAGDYLAYGVTKAPDDHEVVVYDLKAGAVAYSVPIDGDSRGAAFFAVQADGKLARMIRRSLVSDAQGHVPCRELEWFSRAEPFAHGVSGRCPSSQVEMANDKIAYAREADGGRSLMLTDIRNGSTRVVVSAALPDPDPFRGFDFDGERLAYAIPGCTAQAGSIWVDDTSGPEHVEDLSCPICIGHSSLTARRDGTTRVLLSCPRGCAGEVSVVRARRGASEVARARSFSLGRGERRIVALRIKAAARAAVRRNGRLRVDVLVRSETLDTTSRTTTLRR